MRTLHPDAELIAKLGGPAAVARLLNLDTKTGGTQRVQNWRYRGIPSLVRLRRLDLFTNNNTDDAHSAAFVAENKG